MESNIVEINWSIVFFFSERIDEQEIKFIENT